MAFLIVLGAIAAMVLIFLAAAVKIVRPYQRGIVERLGKYKATVEPGLQVPKALKVQKDLKVQPLRWAT